MGIEYLYFTAVIVSLKPQRVSKKVLEKFLSEHEQFQWLKNYGEPLLLVYKPSQTIHWNDRLHIYERVREELGDDGFIEEDEPFEGTEIEDDVNEEMENHMVEARKLMKPFAEFVRSVDVMRVGHVSY